MARTGTEPGNSASAGVTESPTADEIREQVRAILASPVFHSSKRGQQFVEYVCERALAGETGALKERNIAVEVFGRKPDSGLGEDTIVRVAAREVRKRLAQYYMTPEGAAAPILMELPPGSYVPEFHYVALKEHSPEVAPAPAAAPAVPEAVAARRQFPIAAVALVLVPVLAIGAFAIFRSEKLDSRTQAFQKFWAPAFDSAAPLLIGVGHPIVYLPSLRTSRLNAERLGAAPIPMQRQLALKPSELTGSDFVPMLNQFVGFGDMVAANEVTQMMAHRARPVRILLASSIPFADLRQSPTYLIGSLTNQWTMELGQNWRFQFNWNSENKAVIRDTATQKDWHLNVAEDGSVPEDYSLICRIRNSPTGGLLIVSAGIKQFGTEAAGRILSDPARLGQILGQLKPGWEERNVQIVLRTRIIGNTPAQPETVASHVW